MTTQVETNASSSSHTSYLDLIGSKLRHKLGSQINEHITNGGGGSSIPAFAKAQLEKLGWKEGEGLGKRRQGMASHIKVVQRSEGLGLGESTLDPALHQSLAAQDWWKHSVGNTLAKLSSKNKNKKDKKDKKKNKKSKDDKEKEATSNITTTTKVYTDEELFQATGGARFGMRAQTRQQAKWKRAESNISAEEEQEAKRKVEWDGMAPPQVLLTVKNETTTTQPLVEDNKKNKKNASEESNTMSAEEKEARKREKKEKKKKRRRKEEESLEKNDDNDDDDKKSTQKSKKQKVSKKQA